MAIEFGTPAPSQEPAESAKASSEEKKERRKSLVGTFGKAIGSLLSRETKSAEPLGQVTPDALIEAKAKPGNIKIERLFASVAVDGKWKSAKTDTPEFIRHQVDLMAKATLIDTAVLEDEDLSLQLLESSDSEALENLEKLLHDKIRPELAKLKPEERDIIEKMPFKAIIRAKLEQLLVEKTGYSKEEVALASGAGKTSAIVEQLETLSKEALKTKKAQILAEFSQINPLDVDLPTLALARVTAANREIVLRIWTTLTDEIGSSLKIDPHKKEVTDEQLDRAVQWGQLLTQLEKMKETTNLNQKSLAESLLQQASSRYPSMKDVEELLKLTYKAPKEKDQPLCRAHLRSLTTLARYHVNKLSGVSDFDKKVLARFILNSLGSKEMYKRAQNTFNGSSWLLEQPLFEQYSSFTANGLDKERFALIANKFDGLQRRVLEEHKDVGEAVKLSREEFGIAFRASSLWETLANLNRRGLFQVDDELMAVGEDASSINSSYVRLEQALLQEIADNKTYQSGDILVWRLKSFLAIGSRGVATEQWLMKRFVTEKSHAAHVYLTKPQEGRKSEPMISHVMAQYQNQPFGMESAFLSEGWRLQAHRLLKSDPEVMSWLNEMFQVQKVKLEEGVDAAYHEGARHFHEDLKENFANIHNPEERRFAAGLADFGLKGGHKRSTPRESFEPLHELLSTPLPEEKQKMICTEFVSKTTIAALVEADYQLVDQLKAWIRVNVKSSAEAERRITMIEKRQEEQGLVFLDIPFSAKERLKRVHPGRLVKVLEERGCIVAIKPPEILTKIVQTSALR